MQLIVGQLLNGAIVGTIYGILALSISLTFGLTGIVNFAIGAFMMVGAYAAWAFTVEAGLPFPFAVCGAVLVCAIGGYVVDRGLFRFTRDNLVNGLLVSIGLIWILDSLAMMIFTATPMILPPVVTGAFVIGDVFIPKMRFIVFCCLAVFILATYFFINKTWTGRAIRSFAQNREGAILMGVNGDRLQSGIFVYSTALAGFGGALYASLYSIEPHIGGLYVLKAVEAAILAGIGSTMGVLVAGIALGIVENVGSLYLPLAFRDAYGLIALVLVLLFRPEGIFTRRK